MNTATNTAATTALLAALALAPQAPAQDTTFTYQGALQDAGSPANGTYDIDVTLFDALTNGTPLATQSFDDVTVANGLFTIDITAPEAAAGSNPFLEIRVKRDADPTFTTLSPRTRINDAPSANTARNAIQSFRVIDPLNPTNFLNVAPDTDGVASILTLARPDGDPGLTYDGNYLDLGLGPFFSVQDQDTIFVFDTTSTGNNTVRLPTGAIDNFELFNEAGLAATSVDNSDTTLSPGERFVPSVVIDAPRVGYAIVTATFSLEISHLAGTDTIYQIGINKSSTLQPSVNTSHEVYAGQPTNFSITRSHTVTASYHVDLGQTAFFVPIDVISGSGISSVTVRDIHVAAVYIPTLYGNFNSPTFNAQPFTDPEEQLAASNAQPTSNTPAPRTDEALAILRTEIDLLRQEVANLREQLRVQRTDTPTTENAGR